MIDVPETPLDNYEKPSDKVASELGLANTYVGSLDFGVVGSGQSGCRLALSFHDLGYMKTLAINTAQVDLKPLTLPEEQKLKIGDFEGSGKNMDKGAKAADDFSQSILDKFREVFGAVDKIVICIGAGGGSGAGSLLVLIKLATKYLETLGHKNASKDIITIVALPTAGELNSAVVRANDAKIKEVLFKLAAEGQVGPIILIDNAKIEKLYRGIPPAKFWPTINATITGLFQMFNYLSKQESGYTSFDEEDYQTVLTTPGLAVLGVTKVDLVKGEKLSQALQDNLKKTLLSDAADYATAKEAACVVVAGTTVMESMTMDSINYGFDTMANLIGSATVHRGLYDTEGDVIKAYTLITGMSPKGKQLCTPQT